MNNYFETEELNVDSEKAEHGLQQLIVIAFHGFRALSRYLAEIQETLERIRQEDHS